MIQCRPLSLSLSLFLFLFPKKRRDGRAGGAGEERYTSFGWQSERDGADGGVNKRGKRKSGRASEGEDECTRGAGRKEGGGEEERARKGYIGGGRPLARWKKYSRTKISIILFYEFTRSAATGVNFAKRPLLLATRRS